MSYGYDKLRSTEKNPKKEMWDSMKNQRFKL